MLKEIGPISRVILQNTGNIFLVDKSKIEEKQNGQASTSVVETCPGQHTPQSGTGGLLLESCAQQALGLASHAGSVWPRGQVISVGIHPKTRQWRGEFEPVCIAGVVLK